MKKLNPWKFLVVAVLAAYGVAYAADHTTLHYIDALDFLIYRGGRMLFSPLGELQHNLGGSVAECMVPALFIVYYCWKRNFHSAGVFGFWLGINFFTLAVYAANAASLSPTNLNADQSLADWNWVLNHFNAVTSASSVASVFRFLGYATYLLSTIAGIIFSREAVAEPAPEPTGHAALAEATPGAAQPASWEQTAGHSPGMEPATKTIIVLVCVIGGAVAVWNHGGEWVQSLLDRAAPKPAWPNNYAVGATQAKTEGKPIVLSFTGSDWCPACKELDKYILDTAIFRDYAAKNLVFIEVDMPQHKSLGAALEKQNMQLCMKYDVHSFPTLLILSSDEKLLGQIVGFGDSGPKAYIAEIEGIAKIKGKR